MATVKAGSEGGILKKTPWRILATVVASAAAYSCGGGGGGGGNSPPPAPTEFVVSGVARYEKRGIDAATATLTSTITDTPVPYATVEVVEVATGVVLAQGGTDLLGQFTVNIPITHSSSNILVRVLTSSAVAFAALQVQDHSSPAVVYSISSASFVGGQSGISLVASASDLTGRLAGPFNIFAQVIRGMQFIRAVDPAATFPPLGVLWTFGNDTGPPP